MKLLITGGAGFVGSNFIRCWLKKHPKDAIINLDKLTYAGHLSSTKDFKDNPNYKFVTGDITDPKKVNALMKGIDYVVHFAAESHVDRSILDPAIFVKSNVLGTQILLDAAYDPRSPYSASKAGSDHLVRSYFHSFGLPITITNCANNFGPYHDPEKFIPRHIIRFLTRQKATIYGDGKYTRDWLYVTDHCRAIELVLLKGKIGETYLVGSQTNKEYSNIEVVRMLLSLTGLDESFIEFVKDRPGHDRRYAIDWSKIRKELGWKPEFDFENRLEKTVAWYKQNKWWWQPLVKRAESIY